MCVCVCVCVRAVYFNINCTGRNLDEVFIKGKKEALKFNEDVSFFVK